MRIVFIGTVRFSLCALDALINMGENIVGVITKSESPFNSDFVDLTPLCVENYILVKHTTNINNRETISWIRSLKSDVIFCVGWSDLLGSWIRNIPSKGVVGFHPAALPKNRGRCPLVWALALGLKETASTFFFIDEGVDSGDIISQEHIPIYDYDDALSLYNRICVVMSKQLEGFVPKLKNGSLVYIPQDHSIANTWRIRTQRDGEIDFRMSSRTIYNLVRALAYPYVNAHFVYKGKDIKVQSAILAHADNNIEPGKVLFSGMGRVMVKCGSGAIVLNIDGNVDLPSRGEYL